MDSLVSLANKNAMDDMSKMLTLSILVSVLVPVSCNGWMLNVGCCRLLVVGVADVVYGEASTAEKNCACN